MSKLEIPSVLSRIRVKSPCDQGWDTMQGNDRVRFCDHCAKHVNNLSEMTPAAALELIEQSEGRLCAHFIAQPNGAPRLRDPEVATGLRLPRLSGLAAGLLSAVLAVGTASAQEAPSEKVTQTRPEEKKPQPTGDKTVTPKTDPAADDVVMDGLISIVSPVEVWVKHDTEREKIRAVLRERNPEADPDELPGNELFKVIAEGGPEDLRALLEQKPDPNVRNPYGDTPLMVLIEAGDDEHTESLELLIDVGADVNAANRFGVTPLMTAMIRQPAAVNALIDAGANVNAADDNGRTTLMLAAFNGDVDTVRLLVRAGADVNARDAKGQSVLGYALADGDNSDTHKRVVKLLKKAGARE